VPDFTLIEKGHWLKTAMWVWAYIKWVNRRADFVGAEVV
jgi:hypothetical protein